MRTTIKNLKRRIILEMTSGADQIEVGDLVDVDLEYAGRVNRIRVKELVPDVRDTAGVLPFGEDPSEPPGGESFDGPGFIGVSEDEYGVEFAKGEEGLFSLKQVIPGSKIKYYFPEDEYGRNVADLP